MSITLEHVDYTYNLKTPLEHKALSDVNLNIKDNTITAIVGHTGSGKSTLLQLFDGLLKPTVGKVTVDNFELNPNTKNKGLKSLRKNVGIVFQLPENQLFAETVLQDVMFGPKNFGYSEEQAEQQARKWLKRVGIDEELFSRSPFDLSGGQMRRVAIAGVLAYEPKMLCLDEPAAGLDPAGKEEILNIFKKYQAEGHGVILISHDMNDVANFADEVIVMDSGRVLKHDKVKNIFSDPAWLKKHHLDEPETASFIFELKEKGINIETFPLTISELAEEIVKRMQQ